jgi:hypothetical protein
MGASLNTEGYKQRLQAEERRLLKSIDRAEANARDLSDGLLRVTGATRASATRRRMSSSRKQIMIRLSSTW